MNIVALLNQLPPLSADAVWGKVNIGIKQANAASESPAFELRDMEPSDSTHLHEIERESFPDDPYPEDLFKKWLNVGTGSVATVGGVPVAYLLDRDGDQAGTRYVQSIAVHPKHRRTGMGKALIQRFVDAHPDVSAHVATDNIPSRRMFKNFGFKATRTTRTEGKLNHFMTYARPEKQALTRETLVAAATQTKSKPTAEEKESGRYKKGRVSWKGLTLVIETAKGDVRSGKSKDGTEWSITMRSSYGYLSGYKSEADGDNVDVFINDEYLDSELVFIVDQVKKSGEFDEHKILLGWIDTESAKQGYLENYSKGWKGLGDITPITLPQFKEWLEYGDTKKPYARTTRQSKHAGVRSLAFDAESLLSSNEQGIQTIRRAGDTSLQKMAEEFCCVPYGYGTVSTGANVRTEEQQEKLHTEQLQVGDTQGTGEKQANDQIINAQRQNVIGSGMVRDTRDQAINSYSSLEEWNDPYRSTNDGCRYYSEEDKTAFDVRWGDKINCRVGENNRIGSQHNISPNQTGLDGESGIADTATTVSRQKEASVINVYKNAAFIMVKRATDDDTPFTIAFDLDGTLAKKEEPFDPDSIGEPREEAVAYARKFKKAGARIIIFTVRGDTELVAAWAEEHDVPYDYINENPDQPEDGSGKVIADVYIDDKAIDGNDPEVYGPEVLRRIRGEESEAIQGMIIRHEILTITPIDLLSALEEDSDDSVTEIENDNND